MTRFAVVLHITLIFGYHFLARLSFALAASKIKEKARVLSMDLRGHGKSVTDNDLDLSIEVRAFLVGKSVKRADYKYS